MNASLLEIPLYGIAAIVAATLLGGVLRGFTGGAGAVVVVMPVLSAFVGAREAVPVGVSLMLLTGFQLGRRALRDADLRETAALSIACILLIPAGAWLLFTVDEELMRRAVAVMAILFAAILLSGWRHTGPRGPAMASVAGGLSGLISGAVGMGGPPMFLYVMSGPAPAHVQRGTIALSSSITPVVTLIAMAVAGAFVPRVFWLILLLAPVFVFGTWAGTRFFGRVDEALFRRLALGAMIVVSVLVLFL
ncbi:MAG: sulfite exporter TauE/SafE family protein [Rhodospirillaceae bacterium]|nr:sulfite exporter TauE/SafE family protein [Rhodospirillaceae bacterium]MYF86168.1 sulfite exporter TauE/SafE family protein [Rhodospirillaceae bacterium]MYH37828.1 sulfite exporter TauE/SafE family protein [Rhodospirillaceae bacterium]MYK14986.1 sulfite exporter TauE/SafE family protein [Rhodospirillaceae bacterium]MYK59544.1 sulfite exporter TauE/SafE family protein [Rhodospirillaceae bacterium]